jgi:hypothetical protein
MKNILQEFLNDIAEHAKPDYKNLLTGIAQDYSDTGSLSSRQRRSVRIAANQRYISCPIEFEEMKAERDVTDEYLKQNDKPTGFKAAFSVEEGEPMPEFRITSEDAQRVMRALVDEPLATSPNDIFADTLFEIAAALQVCAFRLKEIT